MATQNAELQECDQILKYLLQQQISEAFAQPVDWEFYGLTDYPEIIKKPMDLGTIQGRLDQSKYPNADKFAADVRLVWRNAMTYNRPDSEIYRNAEKLGKMFEKRFNSRKSAGGSTENKAGGGTKRKRADGKNENVSVTRGDRVTFSKLVDKLSSEELGQLVDMVQRDCPTALNEEDEKEIEIEINAIDSATLMNLIEFAQTCVSQSQNKRGGGQSAAPVALQQPADNTQAPGLNNNQQQQQSSSSSQQQQQMQQQQPMSMSMQMQSSNSAAAPMLNQAPILSAAQNSGVAPMNVVKP
jgi:hypothetical protein